MTRLTPSIPHASPRREADGANVPAMPNRAPTARPVAARTLSPQSLTNRYLHDGRDFTASRRYRTVLMLATWTLHLTLTSHGCTGQNSGTNLAPELNQRNDSYRAV